MFCQRFCDLNQLLLAHSDILDQRTGRFLQSYCLQIFIRFAVCLVPVDGICFSFFITKVHVLPDGHVGDQRQFLMDDNDAFLLAVLDLRETADLSVINNISLIGAIGIDSA